MKFIKRIWAYAVSPCRIYYSKTKNIFYWFTNIADSRICLLYTIIFNRKLVVNKDTKVDTAADNVVTTNSLKSLWIISINIICIIVNKKVRYKIFFLFRYVIVWN